MDSSHARHTDAAQTCPTQCSCLRRGGYVVLKKNPCKIVELLTSSPGKHGPAKVHLVGLDVISGKKYEDIFPAAHKVDVPKVMKTEYEVIDISDGFLSLMDTEGSLREDLQLPSGNPGKEIEKGVKRGAIVMVTVISALSKEALISVKTVSQ